jgi:hypothetical protein
MSQQNQEPDQLQQPPHLLPPPTPNSFTNAVPPNNNAHLLPVSTLSQNSQIDIRNTPQYAPWKYVGYKTFSRWMASDSAFLVVRRFGALNARIALSMQDEIVQLEEQLLRYRRSPQR